MFLSEYYWNYEKIWKKSNGIVTLKNMMLYQIIISLIHSISIDKIKFYQINNFIKTRAWHVCFINIGSSGKFVPLKENWNAENFNLINVY